MAAWGHRPWFAATGRGWGFPRCSDQWPWIDWLGDTGADFRGDRPGDVGHTVDFHLGLEGTLDRLDIDLGGRKEDFTEGFALKCCGLVVPGQLIHFDDFPH